MVKNLQGKDYNYLIILVVLYKGITGTMRVLSNWGSPEIPLFFTEQAIFYPIVGYYLGNVLTEEKYTKKKLIIGAILSGVSILAGSLLTYYDYKCSGEWLERGSDILIPIAAITIFYGVRFYYLNGKQHEKVDKFCMFFGENSFGVYLFSIYLQLKMLFVFGFFDKFLPCIVACCLYVVVVMAFGTILVAILRKIPIVRRLL